jgi:hypothetical protein
VKRDEWVAAIAAGPCVTPPTPDELDTMLELFGVASHASERTAAPIMSWLAATSGLSAAAALDVASSLGA